MTWFGAKAITCSRSGFDNLFRHVLRLPIQSRFVSTSVQEVHNRTVNLSNGKELLLSIGKYARMADGSAVVQSGQTAVLVTAVCGDSEENGSHVPLSVDFRMKSAAAGRIPTNFLRRELGPSDREILTSRVIDRSIRPLFPPNFSSIVHVACNLLAVDGVHDPEVLAINAASLALSVSPIPWDGPVAAVRVGLVDGELIINPSRIELQNSQLNLIVTGRQSSCVLMLEGHCDNLNINDLLHAIRKGLSETQKIILEIQKLANEFGKKKKSVGPPALSDGLVDLVKSHCSGKIREILQDFSFDKQSRDLAIAQLREKTMKVLSKSEGFTTISISSAFGQVVKKIFRDLIFETNIRCDGRTLSDVRNISCEVGLYEPLHGSAMFQRGQTQVLCTVALDSPQSAIKTDTYTAITSGVKEKNFFLHYEFPAYATNEAGPHLAANRREIGHGSLAEKSLAPVVPKDYPFCIRLTSEVLESNGSSSMATVCGGTLALLDAGIPLLCSVSGVAMGLITEYDETGKLNNYRILTDILGMEDHLGDMDFKIGGTKTGITAIQLDLKIPGLPMKIISEAIAEAHSAKRKILNIMNSAISTPRLDKGNLPVIEVFEVPPHKRSKLTGVGQMHLKRLFLETGVQITPVDELKFSAFAPNEIAMQEAYDLVRKSLDAEYEPNFDFGGIYSAKVVEIRDNGVMVSLHPKLTPVFLHNNHLDVRKVAHPSALGLVVGDHISVKYFGRDPSTGHMRLSRKVLLGGQGFATDSEQENFKDEFENPKSASS